MTPKQVFRNALQCKSRERPPFVPFVCGLAARTANIGVRQMVIDPGLYSTALEGVHALLGSNMITVNFDAGMESEVLGAEVQWSGEYDAAVVKTVDKIAAIGPDDFVMHTRTATVIETVKRLSITAGREKAVGCALLGPCAFIHILQKTFKEKESSDVESLAKEYGGHLTKFVRILCEQKIDAFFFREDVLGEQFMQLLSRNQSAIKGLYATLFNIVKAFNAFPLIIADQLAVESIRDLHEILKPNGIVLTGHAPDQDLFNTFLEVAEDLKISIGLPLPAKDTTPETLSRAVDVLASLTAKKGPRNFFYCSDGEIPHDIDLAILLELLERINSDLD